MIQDLLNQISTFLDTQYPPNVTYQYLISEDAQLREIEKLKTTLDYEHFFFVVDLEKRAVVHCHGVAQWLGYPDESFTFERYLSIIHPSKLSTLSSYAQEVIVSANVEEQELSFLNKHNSFTAHLPLQHENNTWLEVKRIASPFQIDTNGKVLAYLNHFSILHELNGEETVAMKPLVKGTESEKVIAKIKENVINSYKSNPAQLDLNPTDLNILKGLLTDIQQDTFVSISQSLQNLGVAPNYRGSWSNRILVHFREYYGTKHDFKTLNQLVLFLHKEGVI